MEKTNLLTLVVTLTVGIILAGSLLMPVLTDTTTTERTFNNDGYFTLNKLLADDETTHTLVWDASENGKIITVDGTDMDVTTWGLSAYQQVTVFATESDLFRLGYVDNTQALGWIQVRGTTIAYAGAASYFSATIGGGTASISIDSEVSPRTLSYTEAYMIADADGDYVMKKSNEAAYLNSDSPIYSLGFTSVAYNGGTLSTVMKIDGTIETMTATSILTTDPEITTSDIVVDAPAATGYIDLYKFNKVTFVATAGTDTTNCTYSYVIVPASVTAELSQHLNAGEIALLNALPILVIIGLVMAGVGVIFVRNRD